MNQTLKTLVSQANGGFAFLDGEVEKFSLQQDWDTSSDFKVRLILEELILNALSYGGNDNEAAVTITDESTRIVMVIEDQGIAFNPLEDAKSADTKAEVEDRDIGGLGVHLVKSMANELSYQRTDDKNILTVVLAKD